jgi:plasmid stabilization system protein ParE
MTPRLVFRLGARAEALDARDWYEARSPGLGLAFAQALDATFEAIVQRPEAFARVRGELRQALLRRFPYSVLFAHDGDEVVVTTVHHHRRDPRRWQSRA